MTANATEHLAQVSLGIEGARTASTALLRGQPCVVEVGCCSDVRRGFGDEWVSHKSEIAKECVRHRSGPPPLVAGRAGHRALSVAQGCSIWPDLIGQHWERIRRRGQLYFIAKHAADKFAPAPS